MAAKETIQENSEVVRSSIWYRDGSIVLQAEQTQFCVHETVLAQHSTVFQNMLEHSPNTGGGPTESVDSRPLVHLSGDSAKDVEYLLAALYDSTKIDNVKLSAETFPMLSGVLRLSTKYLIRKLRAVVEKHFIADIPPLVFRLGDRRTFAELLAPLLSLNSSTRISDFGLPYFEAPSHIGNVDEATKWKLDLADLFQETQLRRGLPLALYYWTLQDPVDIYKKKLSEVSKTHVFEGLLSTRTYYAQLLRSLRIIGMKQKITGSVYGCITTARCARVVEQRLDEKITNGVFSGDDHSLMLNWKSAAVEGDVCDGCEELMTSAWRQQRWCCWAQLPRALGLDQWQKLEQEDAAFLESFN